MNRLKKLGLRAMPTNEIFLEGVKVPKENMVGGLNEGWQNMAKILAHERCFAASTCVGIAQVVLDDTLGYAKKRVQFGKPIGKFQTIQHMLADMQLDVDTSRLLSYMAAWRLDQGLPCNKESAMAKLYSSEVVNRVVYKGLQIFGGYGYIAEYDIERHFRDARFLEIGGGTSQIMRNIIAEEMGL